MKMNVSFAQKAILNKGGLNHLKIEIIPPEIKNKKERTKPVLMIVVLDRSGSMSGTVKRQETGLNMVNGYSHSQFSPNYVHSAIETNTKMRQAINSTVKLIQMLSKEDLFGLVAFDDIAVKVQDLTHILPENQNLIINNVRNIYTGGCTNISLALQMAREMITKEHLKNYNCKIVVLSDGQANSGIQDADNFAFLALKYLQDGISVSALGIGYDYDSKVMNAIATGGGGLFYHIEDLEKLDNVFQEELKLSNTVKAKNVRLILEIPDLIEIGANMNDYKQKVIDKNIEVYIGDIVNSRSVFFEIRNNFVDTDVEFRVKVAYQTVEGDECVVAVTRKLTVVDSKEKLEEFPKDQSIIDNVLSLIKHRTFLETSDMYEKGKTDELRGVFSSTINYVQNICSSYSLNENTGVTSTLDELTNLNETYASNSVSKSFTKNLYAQSARSLR
jgi:Ca-activated chloride channel family protein